VIYLKKVMWLNNNYGVYKETVVRTRFKQNEK